VNHLTRLYPEARAVNSLAVYQNVAVHYQLASLRHGACKTGA
jgi:hypothetical protein